MAKRNPGIPGPKHLSQTVRFVTTCRPNWGIRGSKAAARDSDEKVRNVVHDALAAGDIDDAAFEDGLVPETLVQWLPLADLWTLWRGGKLTQQAVRKALSTAHELGLFDARWFLSTIQAKESAVRGTDVLAERLTREDLAAWIRKIHETGDGTPKGILTALGWDKIAASTATDNLVAVLDQAVAKAGLGPSPARESKVPVSQPQPQSGDVNLTLDDDDDPTIVVRRLDR